MNPDANAQPIALVGRAKYGKYKPNADLETGSRCIKILEAAGYEVEPDYKCNWLIDTFPMIFRMFPSGCPPVTIISQNSFFEPHFHVEIGRILRPLRKEGYLFIGSGGGVHNLYRTEWKYMFKYRDNFAQEKPPEPTHLEFRQALEDVICKNGGGPAMKQGVVRLMKHPYYRDAHGTDDHYMPTCFIAGVVGEEEDRKDQGVLGAELWELVRTLLPFMQSFSNDLSTARGTKERHNSCLGSGPRHKRWYKLQNR
jgi:aromatic ring-opening dioxygenase catalytic subunit (LigB family)